MAYQRDKQTSKLHHLVDGDVVRKEKVQTKYEKAYTATKTYVTLLLSQLSNPNIVTSKTEINRLGTMTLNDFSLRKVPELQLFIFYQNVQHSKKCVDNTFIFPKNKGKLEETTNRVSNVIKVAYDLRLNHIILPMEYNTEIDAPVKISNGQNTISVSMPSIFTL